MIRAIAFVIDHPYVDALACFREPIRHLADAGWHVDLHYRPCVENMPPSFEHPRVCVRHFEMTHRGSMALIAALITNRPRYEAIFTVPQWSLHRATLAGALRGIPVLYISDELIVDDELTTDVQRRWKARERADHRKCVATIALSPERAEFIRDLNSLPADHPTFVIPNSGRGPAQRLRSRYYHDTLDLPDEAFIVLHAGSMGWRPASELAEYAERWRARDPMLVFQGRLLEQMQGRRDASNVRYSQRTLPYALLDYATSSADVGLALYDDCRVNDQLMSTASGKLNLYLKNGLPVITTRLRCFEWVEESGCGVRVESVASVPAAVERIRVDYESYARAARRVYDARLDFARNFAPLERALRDRLLGDANALRQLAAESLAVQQRPLTVPAHPREYEPR